MKRVYWKKHFEKMLGKIVSQQKYVLERIEEAERERRAEPFDGTEQKMIQLQIDGYWERWNGLQDLFDTIEDVTEVKEKIRKIVDDL